MSHRIRALPVLVAACLAAGSVPADEEGVEFFEREIRPLLVERCYRCHSADAESVKGGLLLDSRAGWMRGGDSGSPIDPGRAESSLLIEAVRYTNSNLSMPPDQKLPQKEIDALVRWVAMGAPDPRVETVGDVETGRGLDLEEGREFWSYRMPALHAPPEVAEESWPRSAIDRFLLARMEEEGVEPVGDADRQTLARRVWLDLTGLPPTPEQLERFVTDPRGDALERLVDRLLDSPRFGERWGRHWLDLARYAESVVLRGMLLEHAWRYRDYVIEAFNDDMPLDQFIREQLAGDLIPGGDVDDRRRRLVATTFLTMGDHTLESQDKTQLDMDVVDEQLDVIGKALLAQTITCARCHDHKFDPIPTRDYYALAGILRGIDTLEHANVSGWVEKPLPLHEEDARIHAQHTARVASVERTLRDAGQRLEGLRALPSPLASPAIVAPEHFPGVVIDESDAHAVGEWELSQWTKRYIGGGYLHDGGERKGEKSLTFTPELPEAGTYEVRFAYTPGTNRSTDVPVTVVSSCGEKTVVVDERRPPPIDDRWFPLGEFRFEPGEPALVRVDTAGSTAVVTVDAVQFVTAAQLAESASGGVETGEVAPEVLEARRAEEASRLERSALEEEVERLEARLAELRKRAPVRPMALTVRENDPGDIAIHVRGSVHTLGEVVPRGVLRVTLEGEPIAMPEDESGRLELADWIADEHNPLTARVFVNRAWHWLFGRGIVSTPDNFGTTGQRPTHPELLDWLAVRFMEEGWSVKWLVREIVSSRAYGMSSDVPAGFRAAQVDPRNRLFWRRPLRQLEAECIRDAMLHASGRLELTMGGRSFPAGLNADYAFRYTEPRRSIYVPVFRNARPEIFEVFHGAHPSMVTGKRDVSTVAPQALFLMNHPFVHDQAMAAAERLATMDDVDAGIERAYALVLGRSPTERERRLAARHLGEAEDREAAWTRLVHALFNSLDFRYLR